MDATNRRRFGQPDRSYVLPNDVHDIAPSSRFGRPESDEAEATVYRGVLKQAADDHGGGGARAQLRSQARREKLEALSSGCAALRLFLTDRNHREAQKLSQQGTGPRNLPTTSRGARTEKPLPHWVIRPQVQLEFKKDQPGEASYTLLATMILATHRSARALFRTKTGE